MEPVTTEKTGFALSNATYERLKFLALVFLPALSTLYFALGALWGFPNIEQVVGSIAALDTFLGVILRISTNTYNASPDKYVGAMNIMTNDDGVKLYSLELNSDPNELDAKKSITFKINVK